MHIHNIIAHFFFSQGYVNKINKVNIKCNLINILTLIDFFNTKYENWHTNQLECQVNFLMKMKIWRRFGRCDSRQDAMKTSGICTFPEIFKSDDAFAICLFYLLVLYVQHVGLWIRMCFFYWALWLKWHLRYMFHISQRWLSPVGGMASWWFTERLLLDNCAERINMQFFYAWQTCCDTAWNIGTKWLSGWHKWVWLRLDFSTTNSLIAP